jgi:putative membrane protein insertion efficiency factor
MKTFLLAMLRVYKVAFSPFFGSQCRFYPTCSDYAREAIELHGPAAGTYLAARRLCRCHPFTRGGYDPVPHEASAHAARPSIKLPRP